MSQRTERIDELLRQEITTLLTREVADPHIGFATVTEVETAPDLRHAKVWVSVIGQKGERDDTIAALNRAMPFVRRELGHRLRLRRIPEFQVRLDDSLERGTRVLHLLQEIEEGHTPDDAGTIGESLPTPLPRLPREGDSPPIPEPPDAGGPGPRRRGPRRSGGAGRPIPRGSRSPRRR